MTTDPLKHSSNTLDRGRSEAWADQPLVRYAASFKTKTHQEVVQAALDARDFGTHKPSSVAKTGEESHSLPSLDPDSLHEPGPTLWALRGLMGSLYKGDSRPQLDILNEFFRQTTTVLPDMAAHLWPAHWKRHSGLRNLAMQTQADPYGPWADLLEHLIRKVPLAILWDINHPEYLRGPREPSDYLTQPSIYVGGPDKQITTYEGKPYFSLLASVLKAEEGRQPRMLSLILALDPMGHQRPEVREQSLIELATQHRSKPLLDYARPRLDAEQIVQTERVTQWGQTLPLYLLKRGLYEEFVAEVKNINQLDQQGLSFFHHLLSDWSHVRRVQPRNEFEDKPLDVMQEEAKKIMEKWNFLISLGGDPEQPCTPPPTTTLILFKSGAAKGKPAKWVAPNGKEENWKKRMAYPGETAIESLRRRITPPQKNQSGFPEAIVHIIEAGLRFEVAHKVAGATPMRRRSRMRS